MDHHNLPNWIGNGASAIAVIGSLLGALPVIAALIAIVWYAIQIRESETYRTWRRQRRERQLSHLKAQLLLLEDSLRLEPPEED